MNGETILSVRNLKTYFYLDSGIVRAVNGVSFDVVRGRTLGIVGESGCGKSVTSKTIMRILRSPPARIVDGSILCKLPNGDVDLARVPQNSPVLRKIRGNFLSMVFQEPMNAFSPIHSVGSQIVESLFVHEKVETKSEAFKLGVELLDRVGIPDAAHRYNQLPDEFSGGMRQRALIAMALACDPSLLIADEPTTALDVTVQAQILNLLNELQAELGMAMIFITHDLSVISEMADDVAVMYLGSIVEEAAVDELFVSPSHPYTRALLESIPALNEEPRVRLRSIPGSVPDSRFEVAGCPFADRCPVKIGTVCETGGRPPLYKVSQGHYARCHLFAGNPVKDTDEANANEGEHE